MNTTQLKKFAQEARKKLITLVSGRLEAVLKQDSASLRAKAETINKLNQEIEEIGKETLIDKVAYTWFNRLVALRFMDVNDFQPLGINILSPANGTNTGSPQILSDINAGMFPEDLKLDRDYINNVLNGVITSTNAENDIYRHVLIAVCNDLHRIFPFLFEKLDDYSELLLPDDLTTQFSIVADIVNGMSVEDCKEVEIIGWLYQFYISEKKDEVFASKSKVRKEDIPAATQLFTPRWIVEYMVQNTVGKLWLQNNPTSGLKQHMPYYIESSEVASEDYLKINSVEDIKLLDQACGSGHILVYGFELFAKIYEEQGYSAAEIPTKIIENNLYGLEIDERAAQLATFAITMKARQYYRRFFRKPIMPNIVCYEDIKLNEDEINNIITKYNVKEKEAFTYDLVWLEQATNLGSLIQPHTSLKCLETIKLQLDVEGESNDLFWQPVQKKLLSALKQLIALAQKYHCVVQNPPYMGGGKYNEEMSHYVNATFPDSKADLFSCFIERSVNIAQPKGLIGNVTMESWMFLSSFEKFRTKLLKNTVISSLTHFGWHIMRIAFGTVAFILKNSKSNGTEEGVYNFLEIDDINREIERPFNFPNTKRRYSIKNQKDFEKIPGNNIGYWLSNSAIINFSKQKISDFAHSFQGIISGNNDKLLRLWFELPTIRRSSNFFSFEESKDVKTFVPYQKGGNFRKWYGNNDYYIYWNGNGKHLTRARYENIQYYFKPCLSWTFLSSTKFGIRKVNGGSLWDVAGSSCFPFDEEKSLNILAVLCSKIGKFYLDLVNPTLNFQVENVLSVPISSHIFNDSSIKILSELNLHISKREWDSREISWDFLQNELIRFRGINVQSAVNAYIDYWTLQFNTLHKNEEELNRQFIEIYDLQDELTPDVPLEDITILKDESTIVEGQLVFKEQELIQQLISYAIGCIFGRYSLDKEGLILGNQGESIEDYFSKTEKPKEQLQFIPDADNVIPVLEEEWFDDDIVNRVKEFIRSVWGEKSFQENIQYIEEILGKDLRKYLTKDFYKDHIKRYKKRPIYWQFSSPKGHFNVLIYMHRYTQDTLNQILNEYLRSFITKVENDLARQEDIVVTGTATEQGKARKRQDKLKEILLDCKAYERDILFPLAGERIAINLDDGVLVNYNKFGKTIAPVTGLNDATAKKKVKGFDWIDTSTIR